MSDYDSPWKEALDCYFEWFVALLFPRIHEAIDWSQGFESLDKELQQIMPDAEVGRRYVDKLVKVWRKEGGEEWVLIHIEVQSNNDDDFARRMFIYHYRLLDRYDRKVASLAVLGDDRADWRPDRYNCGIWGCSIEFRFPSVKLLDYESKWQALEADPNPFAVVVLAHLKARETAKDPETRKAWKFRIVKSLYERGMGKADVRQMFRFIDWMMELPPPLALEFNQDLSKFEKEKHVPYVTSIERIGIEKGELSGERKGLIKGLALSLELKFGKAGLKCLPMIRKIDDLKSLDAVGKAIKKAATVDELRAMLD